MHISYWRGIRPEGKFEVPADKAVEKAEEPKNEAANDALSAQSTTVAPAPKAPAAKNKASILGK